MTDESDESDEGLVLSRGADGEITIRKPEDYVEMLKTEADLVKEFIDENKELFQKFLDKKGDKE